MKRRREDAQENNLDHGRESGGKTFPCFRRDGEEKDADCTRGSERLFQPHGQRRRRRAMETRKQIGDGSLQRKGGTDGNIQRWSAEFLMAQFDVYENRAPGSKTRVPYLLDVQHGLLEHLKTRVVIPLVAEEKPIAHLNPSVEIGGKRYMLSTQEMAGVPLDVLGTYIVSVEADRDVIIHAIDFLVTGF